MPGASGSVVCGAGKNDDRFPVQKLSPPLLVVIKVGPGKWAPFFWSWTTAHQKMGTFFLDISGLETEVQEHFFFDTSGPETGVEELLFAS